MFLDGLKAFPTLRIVFISLLGIFVLTGCQTSPPTVSTARPLLPVSSINQYEVVNSTVHETLSTGLAGHQFQYSDYQITLGAFYHSALDHQCRQLQVVTSLGVLSDRRVCLQNGGWVLIPDVMVKSQEIISLK